MAAILDFEHTSTSHETERTTIRKFYSENICVAVGILSLCALELEICLGPFHPPSCRQTSQKNRCHQQEVAYRLRNVDELRFLR